MPQTQKKERIQKKTSLKKTLHPEEEKENHFYIALGHEIRRSIITIIGHNKKVGFSQIKDELQIGTGTIYHHLKALQDLIYQDSSKKYHLTPLGKRAYRFLMSSRDSITSTDLEEKIRNEEAQPEKQTLWNLLLMRPLITFVLKKERKGTILSTVVLLLTAFLCGIWNIRPFFYFFIPYKIGDPNPGFQIQYSVYMVLSFVILAIITEALIRFVFNIKKEPKEYIRLLPLSFLPMLLSLIFYPLTFIFPTPPILIYRAIMILFQIWSMIILSIIISLTKEIRLERGILIAVFIDYATFMLLLMINVPF